MSFVKIKTCLIALGTALFLAAPVHAEDFPAVPDSEWDEVAVRKVLQTFAYGGLATEEQIALWAQMPALDAVNEMLSFDPVNDKLSPSDGLANDLTVNYADSLELLQYYWSNDEGIPNPVVNNAIANHRPLFAISRDNGIEYRISADGLAKTWMQAVNTRGLNPFRHKVGLYLTNYHMALDAGKANPGLLRDMYDDALDTLTAGGNMVDVLAEGSVSAAVARAYGHKDNRYTNYNEQFYGNDDFAREFHQLFFRIQGTSEAGTPEQPGQEYHEKVTIEHTAWALTGMKVDRRTDAYGSDNYTDWFVAPIDFTNHNDPYSNALYRNQTDHFGGDPVRSNYQACLEIYHQQICGDQYPTAYEKLHALAQIAGNHPESLANMPVTIIDFFADDNLSMTGQCAADIAACSASELAILDKLAVIRAAWQWHNKDLLGFLRAYAASTLFHEPQRVKYLSAFDRNLTVQNLNVLDNQESFIRRWWQRPQSRMTNQGVRPFFPAHDVFGGQTGLQAANNPNIFRDAYLSNVTNPGFIDIMQSSQTDDPDSGWNKDWGSAIPRSTNGTFVVADVADWLWKRFVGDGGKNFDPIARAQVHALLATGHDFAYRAEVWYPQDYNRNDSFNSAQLQSSPLLDIDTAHASSAMNLDSTNIGTFRTANQRVGMAINFITATPYVFAQEGK